MRPFSAIDGCCVQMMYSLSITVSNLHAMYQPVASIPLSGTVPAKVSGIILSD